MEHVVQISFRRRRKERPNTDTHTHTTKKNTAAAVSLFYQNLRSTGMFRKNTGEWPKQEQQQDSSHRIRKQGTFPSWFQPPHRSVPKRWKKNNSNLAKELKEYCRSPGTHKISEKPAALPEISWSTEENLLLADSSYCQVKEKGGGAPRKNTAFTRAHKIMKPGRKITKLDTMRGLAQTMQVYLKKSIYIYILFILCIICV